MARSTPKGQIVGEAPEWPHEVAAKRIRDLLDRGRTLQARGAPNDERDGWETAVDSSMAAAFGRNSAEHLAARSAIMSVVFMAGMPDRYLERLSGQLAILDEYAKVLEQRAADAALTAPKVALPPPAVDTVLHILGRFTRAARHLKSRRGTRPPLLMDDEHDVQYLLHALLDVHFDDVRPEEFAPSTAGQNVRIDFVLAEEKIAVEAKMTRSTLKDKDVGNELYADIKRYQTHPSCKALVCFVYDPDGHLKNPDGLEKDLSRLHDGLDVRVIVRPKH